MYDGGVNISNLMYVPNEAYKSIEKYRIFKDDIFISVAGTLGIVGKIPKWLDGANLTENANRLTNITCDRDYLLYYLRSPYIQNVISSEQTIGAQPKLALTRIRNFDIALPGNIREQKEGKKHQFQIYIFDWYGNILSSYFIDSTIYPILCREIPVCTETDGNFGRRSFISAVPRSDGRRSPRRRCGSRRGSARCRSCRGRRGFPPHWPKPHRPCPPDCPGHPCRDRPRR